MTYKKSRVFSSSQTFRFGRDHSSKPTTLFSQSRHCLHVELRGRQLDYSRIYKNEKFLRVIFKKSISVGGHILRKIWENSYHECILVKSFKRSLLPTSYLLTIFTILDLTLIVVFKLGVNCKPISHWFIRVKRLDKTRDKESVRPRRIWNSGFGPCCKICQIVRVQCYFNIWEKFLKRQYLDK